MFLVFINKWLQETKRGEVPEKQTSQQEKNGRDKMARNINK
jgi:hypothetical protein